MEHHGRRGARRKYREPIRTDAAQMLTIKLFCHVRGCNNYTIGKEGYNGSFYDEDGESYADLRNQVWYCTKHAPVPKFRLWIPDGPFVVWDGQMWIQTGELEELVANMSKIPDRPKNMDFGMAIEVEE